MRMARSAVIDLEEIRDYIRLDNPSAATKMVSRIVEAMQCLVVYPMVGRVGRVSKTRELIISGTSFIVMYQVREHLVFILRILHTSQKWPNKKKNN